MKIYNYIIKSVKVNNNKLDSLFQVVKEESIKFQE